MSEEARKRKPEPDADDTESADIEVEPTGDVALSPNDHDHLGQTWEGNPKSNHGLKTDVKGDEETVGLIGQSRSRGGIGVLGKSDGGGRYSVGVRGESDEGVGVTGLGDRQGMGGVGEFIGVFGRANSDFGTGILGRAFADGSNAPASGVEGHSSAGDGAGVFGSGQDGIRGVTTTSYGSGVHGHASSFRASGVVGVTEANSSSAFGVRGTGPQTGVYGDTQTRNGYSVGVRGYIRSDAGAAVSGYSGALSGRTYGVEGTSSSDSYKAAGVHGGGHTGVLAEGFGSSGYITGVDTEATGKRDTNYVVSGVRAEATNDDPDNERYNAAYGLKASASAENGFGVGVIAWGDDYGVYSGDDCRVSGDLDVTGTKNFVETVETANGSREVAYAAVEAGRAMTEATDVARLEDGRAKIDLPAHFGMVTSTEESLSVQVTPYGGTAGLKVTKQSTEQIVVEDLDGAGDYEFSYTVKGTRKGHEDREVVREPRMDIETEREMLEEERSLRADAEAEQMEESAMHTADWEPPEPPEMPEIPERPEIPEIPGATGDSEATERRDRDI